MFHNIIALLKEHRPALDNIILWIITQTKLLSDYGATKYEVLTIMLCQLPQQLRSPCKDISMNVFKQIEKLAAFSSAITSFLFEFILCLDDENDKSWADHVVLAMMHENANVRKLMTKLLQRLKRTRDSIANVILGTIYANSYDSPFELHGQMAILKLIAGSRKACSDMKLQKFINATVSKAAYHPDSELLFDSFELLLSQRLMVDRVDFDFTPIQSFLLSNMSNQKSHGRYRIYGLLQTFLTYLKSTIYSNIRDIHRNNSVEAAKVLERKKEFVLFLKQFAVCTFCDFSLRSHKYLHLYVD